jgi:hypothetical protein
LQCMGLLVALSDAPHQDGRASLSAQSGNGAIITPMRRFPPPWSIEENNNACFIVRDSPQGGVASSMLAAGAPRSLACKQSASAWKHYLSIVN